MEEDEKEGEEEKKKEKMRVMHKNWIIKDNQQKDNGLMNILQR